MNARLALALLLALLAGACDAPPAEEPPPRPRAAPPRHEAPSPESRPAPAPEPDPVLGKLAEGGAGAFENLLHRARELHGKGQPAEALALLERHVAAKPRDAEAHYLAGLCHEAAGHPERALTAYGRTLEHAPGDVRPRARRGMLLFNRGRVEEALPDLEAYLAGVTDPGEREKIERAIRSARQVRQPEPARGTEPGASPPPEAADPKILDALTRGSTGLSSRLREAVALFRAGRYEAAAAALDPLLADQPAHLEARLLRGWCRLRLARWDAAMADLDLAVRAAPQDPRAYALRAQARIKVLRMADALADLDAYLRLEQDPANRRPMERLAAEVRRLLEKR